jgi:hypothetical protein
MELVVRIVDLCDLLVHYWNYGFAPSMERGDFSPRASTASAAMSERILVMTLLHETFAYCPKLTEPH